VPRTKVHILLNAVVESMINISKSTVAQPVVRFTLARHLFWFCLLYYLGL